jgi:hypothetical protein
MSYWFITINFYDASSSIYPIKANSRAQVGRYIKKHVRELVGYFHLLASCEDLADKFEWLKEWRNLDLDNNVDLFVDVVERELAKMKDKDVVNCFEGFYKDSEGYSVTINRIKKSAINDASNY